MLTVKRERERERLPECVVSLTVSSVQHVHGPALYSSHVKYYATTHTQYSTCLQVLPWLPFESEGVSSLL